MEVTLRYANRLLSLADQARGPASLMHKLKFHVSDLQNPSKLTRKGILSRLDIISPGVLLKQCVLPLDFFRLASNLYPLGLFSYFLIISYTLHDVYILTLRYVYFVPTLEFFRFKSRETRQESGVSVAIHLKSSYCSEIPNSNYCLVEHIDIFLQLI